MVSCHSERPDGGDGVLNLETGVITCLSPVFYSVSFSPYGLSGRPHPRRHALFLLCKNGMRLLESYWFLQKGIVNGDIDVGVTGSRIVVRSDIVIYSKGRGQAKSLIFLELCLK